MHYSPAIAIALTACAAATDPTYSSIKANMVSIYSSMPTTLGRSSMMVGTGHTQKAIFPSYTQWSNLSTSAAVEYAILTLSRTIYMTHTVSSYITYCPGPTSFAVQNITYTVAKATNVTVACPTGCVISATGNSLLPIAAPGHGAMPPFPNNTAPFRNTTAAFPYNLQFTTAASQLIVVCPSGNPCPPVASPAHDTCPLGLPCPTPQAGIQEVVIPVGSSAGSFQSSSSTGFGLGSPLGSGSSSSGGGLYSNFSAPGAGSLSGSSSVSTSSGAESSINSTSAGVGLSFSSSGSSIPAASSSNNPIVSSMTSESSNSSAGSTGNIVPGMSPESSSPVIGSTENPAITVVGPSSGSSFESSSLETGSSSNLTPPQSFVQGSSSELSSSALSEASSGSSSPIQSGSGLPFNGASSVSGNGASGNGVSSGAAGASATSSIPSTIPSGMISIVVPSSRPTLGSPSVGAGTGNAGTSAGGPSISTGPVVSAGATAVTGRIVSIFAVAAIVTFL